MDYSIKVDYRGTVDVVKFFQHMNEKPAVQKRYLETLPESLGGTDPQYVSPREKAHAYIMDALCDDAMGFGINEPGVSERWTEPDYDDYDMPDEDWTALQNAYPWIDPTLPKKESVDPGGTAPMEFDE